MCEIIPVKIKILNSSATIPSYAHMGDAGCDLHSIEKYFLKPGETYKFKTGIAMEIPLGHVGLICDRSGLSSNKSIIKVAGVVDATYRGEVLVSLHNLRRKGYEINKGEKIAQMLFLPIKTAIFEVTYELSETSRGEGGFGSTDN